MERGPSVSPPHPSTPLRPPPVESELIFGAHTVHDTLALLAQQSPPGILILPGHMWLHGSRSESLLESTAE